MRPETAAILAALIGGATGVLGQLLANWRDRHFRKTDAKREVIRELLSTRIELSDAMSKLAMSTLKSTLSGQPMEFVEHNEMLRLSMEKILAVKSLAVILNDAKLDELLEHETNVLGEYRALTSPEDFTTYTCRIGPPQNATLEYIRVIYPR